MNNKKSGWRWLTGACLLLTLVACTSVPMSTLWRMSQFDKADFLAIEAAALRVRLTADAHLAVDVERSSLLLELRDSEGLTTVYDLKITELSSRQHSESRWWQADRQLSTQLFALTDEGVERLQAFQQRLAEMGPGSAGLSVDIEFKSDKQQQQQSGEFDVAIRLAEDDDYIVLFEGADYDPKAWAESQQD